MTARRRPRLRLEDCVGADFDHRCHELADQVVAFEPDLLVGIRRGGLEVARAMLSHPGLDVDLAEVAVSRPGTGRKDKLRLDLVVRILPQALLDRVRVWEIEWGARRFERRPGVRPRSLAVDPADRAAIARATRIVVVDDAIDSGSTALAALGLIEGANSTAAVKLAALAQTYHHPLVAADFVTCRGVVLRLPWSADATRARPSVT